MTIYRRPRSGVAAGDAIPFYFDGTYHLFHLASPAGTASFPERVRTTWYHARSTDLVKWEEMPAALPPGEGDAPDADGSWTGSLIERNGVFHLFYTGHKLGSKTPQTICHATSRDLIKFTKDAANPILKPDEAIFESIDWRDPFLLWNEDEQVYWMIIAARLRKGPKWRRGCLALATSPDLENWTIETEPFYSPMTTFCPECPEMFQMGGRWYLAYSRFSENAATIYRVSDSPRGPWRVPARETFEGRRWYASKSLPKGDHARVFFGWVHDRAGDTDSGNWLWGGDFTAPREVTADGAGELSVRLPAEVAATYTKPMGGKIDQSVSLSAETGFAHRFLDVSSDQFLLRCTFRPGTDSAKFGLLFRSDDDLDAYALVFDGTRSTATFTHWPPPLDTFWADLVGRGSEMREVDGTRLVEHALHWKAGDSLECTVIVEGSLIEIYIADTVAMAYRVYRKAPHELGFFAEAGAVVVGDIALRQI
jgi:beta-fructofuranosidase